MRFVDARRERRSFKDACEDHPHRSLSASFTPPPHIYFGATMKRVADRQLIKDDDDDDEVEVCVLPVNNRESC